MKCFMGDCVGVPDIFEDVDDMSDCIDEGEEITFEEFLDKCDVDCKTLKDMIHYPGDYDYFRHGDIYWFNWSGYEHFFA